MTDLISRWNEPELVTILASGQLDRRCENGATGLWHACIFGRADWVERLLAAGAQPDAHDVRKLSRDGAVDVWRGVPDTAAAAPTGDSTLLHAAAARAGEPNVADTLIRHGLCVDARDRFGSTPLHIAAFHSNLAFVECLLAAGADPNLHDVAGHTALDHAISKPELVRALLAAGADPNGGPKVPWYGKSYEWSAVTSAAYFGRDGVLEMLLAAGADVSRHPEALPLAAKHGVTHSVQILLEAGADVDAVTHWRFGDRPALEAAAMYASVACAKLLLPQCRHQLDRALQTAVAFCCEDTSEAPNDRLVPRRELVQLLLSEGADPNVALCEAVGTHIRQVENDFLELLLAAGAEVDRVQANGQRALHVAAASGRARAFKQLLAAGADPKAPDRQGETPWSLANAAYRIHHLADARLILNALRRVGAAPEPSPEKSAVPAPAGLSVGDRCHHAKFGPGAVQAVEGQGEKAKVTVAFDSGGQRTLLARFLTHGV